MALALDQLLGTAGAPDRLADAAQRPPGAAVLLHEAAPGGNQPRGVRSDLGHVREQHALGVSARDLYAKGDCSSDPDAECFDKNRWVEAAAVTVPPMPFQNRPTFQQAIEIPKRLPR